MLCRFNHNFEKEELVVCYSPRHVESGQYVFADYLPKIDPGFIVYIFSANKLGTCVIILYPYFDSEVDVVCVICPLFLTPGYHFEDKNVFSVWKLLLPFQSQILLNLDFSPNTYLILGDRLSFSRMWGRSFRFQFCLEHQT